MHLYGFVTINRYFLKKDLISNSLLKIKNTNKNECQKQNALNLGYGKGFLEISSNVEPSCQCSLF